MNKYKCTLFNCKSIKKLQKYLFIQNKNNFKKISNELKNNPLNFYVSFKNNTGRELFSCNEQIKKIHKRLQKLFNVEKSDYLKSGVKKESHITNVKFHKNSNFFLLLDIKNFYPSITKQKIKKQLITTYNQSSDVAEIISNMVTVPQEKALGKRALVTGSVLSQFFAYMINKKMFDELDKISKEENIRFSLYVDDLTFSSNVPVSYLFYTKVYNIIRKNGYIIHSGKIYRGKIGNKSKITGVHITKYGFRLLDRHKIKIREIIKNKDYLENNKPLLGLLNYALQVNPKYSKYMYLIKKKLISDSNI
ncbi:MAG: hypothetical protein GXP61_08675 [Epsilonproteobacteria bacterium]|nr:hypothetical protein [Campylobacterota bacterium]